MSSPKRGVAYDFPIALVDSSDTGSFKASPTRAAGDFKISKDGGAYANLATLPTNVPAGSINVKIVLSATEMTADKITIQCIDAAGAEWDDVLIFIDATVANIDDVVRSTTPANTLDVDASGDITAENMRGTDGANTTTPLSAAQVNAEVDTALDTAIAELSQAQPSATPTLRDAVMLLYMALRNRLDAQTSGTDALEIYNDADTLIAKKLVTDSGGDYSEAKMVSGP